MSRGGYDQRTPSRGPSAQDRLEQARNARERTLEKHRDALTARATATQLEEEQRKARPIRDIERYNTALSAFPFWMSGEGAPLQISGSYRRLIDTALRCMNERRREAILCWPNLYPSASAVAAFLALADSGATDAIKHEGLDSFSPPKGMRSLVFPYARTAHRALRHLYVDKSHLGRLHTYHQVRSNMRGEDVALADYHKTLARAKTLNGLALDGQSYDEFRHPCLDETLPSGPCVGQEGRSEVFWRVRTKTDLRLISRSGKADDPKTARFYLFGLRAGDNLKSSLQALDKNLDLVLLDLTRTSRDRLGKDWLDRSKRFLEELDARVGEVGTLAITDDPWTFDALRFEGLRRQAEPRRKPPTPSSVIFAPQSDILVPAQAVPLEFSDVSKQEVLGFSGEVEALLQRLRAAAKKAAAMNDRQSADTLRQLSGTIRRCASLPGSHEQFAAYVQAEISGIAAADLLTSYRVGGLSKQLSDGIGAWTQTDHSELEGVLKAVNQVWAHTAKLTPMAPLLRDVIYKFKGVSSRTAVLMRNDLMADFATHVLTSDPDIGDTIKSRIQKNMLHFLDKNGFDDLASLPSPKRNHIKTLIVVAPTRAQLLSLLARPWLPESLIFLADSDSLEGSVKDAERLSAYEELGSVRIRLRKFNDEGSRAVHRIRFNAPLIEGDPSDDVEFPTSSVVNLIGSVKPGQSVLKFKLSGEQVVLARPGTKLILQDRSRTVPVFVEAEAKDVDIGDSVCVIGEAFLEMARPILNITARAAEEIRDYHQLVGERFERVPGNSTQQKLQHVVAAMGLADVTSQRAGYWVDLEAQRDVPLHEVVPHAPRDRTTFLAFMKALEVSEAIGARYWTWAVIAQRASRLRAAMSFHDAYRTILVDNYAAQSGNPDQAREIRMLKAAAENFVGTVEDKSEEKASHGNS